MTTKRIRDGRDEVGELEDDLLGRFGAVGGRRGYSHGCTELGER